MAVRQPGLRLSGVEEVLFDRRFDGEGRGQAIKLFKFLEILQIIMGGGGGNLEFSRKIISVSLVPCPFHAFPIRSWNSEHFAELRAIARQGRNELFAGWIKDPTLQ